MRCTVLNTSIFTQVMLTPSGSTTIIPSCRCCQVTPKKTGRLPRVTQTYSFNTPICMHMDIPRAVCNSEKWQAASRAAISMLGKHYLRQAASTDMKDSCKVEKASFEQLSASMRQHNHVRLCSNERENGHTPAGQKSYDLFGGRGKNLCFTHFYCLNVFISMDYFDKYVLLLQKTC